MLKLQLQYMGRNGENFPCENMPKNEIISNGLQMLKKQYRLN